MNRKNLLITLIFITILATATLVAIYTAKQITTSPLVSTTTADFFITNATYIEHDQTGKISNQILTGNITHYPTDNTYFFANPHMIIFSDGNEQPWDVTANRGKSAHGKDKVYLWDNVRIKQAAGPNNTIVDISTNALTIYPKTKYAETDQPVTIIQGQSTAHAVGAQADLKSGTINLLSKVSGVQKNP